MMKYNNINGLITEKQENILTQTIINISSSEYKYITIQHKILIKYLYNL